MITGDFVNGLHLMVGLSTDNKPETTSENTFFLEEDTGDVYYFSAGQWNEAGEEASSLINAILGGGRDLPVVGESDDGKVLGVEDGEWGLVEGGVAPEAIAQAVADWLDENITEPTDPIVDASLSVDGAAADALVTGKIFTDEAKYALLACFEQVAWKTPYGQTYLSALETALFPAGVLSSIEAEYTQTRPILDTNSLDLVKLDLVVTANYSDGTTETLADDAYELTGTLTAGTSTITVSYGGKTDEISVTVKHNYASELSNYRLSGATGVTYADGVISLKCNTANDYNNYSIWAADLKGTTLWDDVNGKTLKVRIYSKGVNFGEYSDTNKIIIGAFAFKDATITSTSADKRKGKTLYSYAPTEQYGWTEGTVECDLSQFTTGTLTPTSESTFGVQITSRSYAAVQIADVEIYEV